MRRDKENKPGDKTKKNRINLKFIGLMQVIL